MKNKQSQNQTEQLVHKIFVDLEIPSVICDEEGKIIWFNKSFNSYFHDEKNQLKNVTEICSCELNELLNANRFNADKFIISTFPFEQKKYLLTIENRLKSDFELSFSTFQKDFEKIFKSLLSAESKEQLYNDFLSTLLVNTYSDISLLIILRDKQKEFFFYDPYELLNETDKVETSVAVNIPFLIKWFEVHNSPLIPEGTTAQLFKELKNSLAMGIICFAPVLYDDKLLAIACIAKNGDVYSDSELKIAGYFSSFLSYGINAFSSRELNNQFQEKLAHQQKLETIGKLASGVAHDFSNILSTIFGSVAILKKKAGTETELLRLIDNIEVSAARAKELTKGLLTYGKPPGKNKEVIHPEPIVEEIVRVVQQTFPARIRFEVNVDENLFDLFANSTQIYQVILNLVVNARDAIEGDGTIILSVSNFIHSTVQDPVYYFLNPGKYVRFSVVDSGKGISSENLNKIFDPYFSTKETEGGTGLGLYVSFGIVKAHEGFFDVQSETGKGTHFDIFLPAYEAAKTQTSRDGEKIILLADDEILLLDLLAEILESYDYTVVKVQNGKEVLRVLTEEIKIDLLIIDYNMPEMDGIVCLREIRKLGIDIPVIFSTGSLGITKEVDLSPLKINALLAKPYDFNSMLSLIKDLI